MTQRNGSCSRRDYERRVSTLRQTKCGLHPWRDPWSGALQCPRRASDIPLVSFSERAAVSPLTAWQGRYHRQGARAMIGGTGGWWLGSLRRRCSEAALENACRPEIVVV